MKEGGCRGPDMVKRASTERCLYGHGKEILYSVTVLIFFYLFVLFSDISGLYSVVMVNSCVLWLN